MLAANVSVSAIHTLPAHPDPSAGAAAGAFCAGEDGQKREAAFGLGVFAGRVHGLWNNGDGGFLRDLPGLPVVLEVYQIKDWRADARGGCKPGFVGKCDPVVPAASVWVWKARKASRQFSESDLHGVTWVVVSASSECSPSKRNALGPECLRIARHRRVFCRCSVYTFRKAAALGLVWLASTWLGVGFRRRPRRRSGASVTTPGKMQQKFQKWKK